MHRFFTSLKSWLHWMAERDCAAADPFEHLTLRDWADLPGCRR